jgi:hypothetical protein
MNSTRTQILFFILESIIPLVWTLHVDNPNTQQTPEYTKDKYNVKIMKRKVSPKVSPTTYIGRRMKERRSERGEGTITK